MITVTVRRENKTITSFVLTGHAESGPYGYDLVCAGVSAVSFGAVNAVSELAQVTLEIEQGEKGGYLSVTIPDTIGEAQANMTQVIFEAMLVSLRTIEREYRTFIQIKE